MGANGENPVPDLVTVAVADGIATVCLNRPEKKNAWTMGMFDALSAACTGLAGDRAVRTVILTGAGDCFSAGLDFSVFGEFAQQLDAIKTEMLNPPAGQLGNRFQQPVIGWQALDIPVIAAIDGVCFGAGMQLALAADFRIAAPRARFSVMESKWGLVPDMGISQSLPGLVRVDQAKDLIMTGRIVGADEALKMGLISRIADDPLGTAQGLAKDLAALSPDAIRAGKRLVRDGWDADTTQALALEAMLQADLIGSPNQVEAVMANIQKRDPKFH